MAWTTPRTWTDTETPTKVIMDTHIRDNLNWVDRAVYVLPAALEVSDSTVLRTLLEATVPAGYMGTKGMLRCVCAGNYMNNATDGNPHDWTLRVRLGPSTGGTTLWEDTAQIGTVSAQYTWRLKFYIANLNSAAVQFMAGSFMLSMHGNTTEGIGDLSTITPGGDGPFYVPLGTNGTAAIDTTGDVDLQVQTQFEANDPNLKVTIHSGYVELVGQAA